LEIMNELHANASKALPSRHFGHSLPTGAAQRSPSSRVHRLRPASLRRCAALSLSPRLSRSPSSCYSPSPCPPSSPLSCRHGLGWDRAGRWRWRWR
jgi:hypothetical protein